MIVNISSVLGHRAVPKRASTAPASSRCTGSATPCARNWPTRYRRAVGQSRARHESEFFDKVLENESRAPQAQAGECLPNAWRARRCRAMRRGRHEIILSPGGKLLVWLDRLSPPLINRWSLASADAPRETMVLRRTRCKNKHSSARRCRRDRLSWCVRYALCQDRSASWVSDGIRFRLSRRRHGDW